MTWRSAQTGTLSTTEEEELLVTDGERLENETAKHR